MKVRLINDGASELLVLTAENSDDLELLKKLHNRTGLGVKLALTERECVGTIKEDEVATLAYRASYLSPKDLI